MTSARVDWPVRVTHRNSWTSSGFVGQSKMKIFGLLLPYISLTIKINTEKGSDSAGRRQRTGYRP